jgi:hypothetical protein
MHDVRQVEISTLCFSLVAFNCGQKLIEVSRSPLYTLCYGENQEERTIAFACLPLPLWTQPRQLMSKCDPIIIPYPLLHHDDQLIWFESLD